jgi:hypothetical protein
MCTDFYMGFVCRGLFVPDQKTLERQRGTPRGAETVMVNTLAGLTATTGFIGNRRGSAWKSIYYHRLSIAGNCLV